MSTASPSITPIAVAYLARGAADDCQIVFERFLRSYQRYGAGILHRLYILFKGFPNNAALKSAQSIFDCVPHTPIFLGDENFDLGAYIEWAEIISEPMMCAMNTHCELLCVDWLLKFYNVLQLPNVGVVGATASYESLVTLSDEFRPFPNIHLRPNGFMMRTDFFRRYTHNMKIGEKVDTFRFESGPNSITRYALKMGLQVLVVGRNGRAYPPERWPHSGTFRQGEQNNLLLLDNQTRVFAQFPWPIKRTNVVKTWGAYIEDLKSTLETD